MMHLTHLDITMPDDHGFCPDSNILGNLLTHTRLGNQYTIIGFAWMGSTDEWGFVHRMVGDHGPEIIRPLKDLYGRRANREWRYEEHEDYTLYADEGNPHTNDYMHELNQHRLEFIATHIDTVIKAFTEMRDNSQATGDTDNTAYWQHELDAALSTMVKEPGESYDKNGNSNNWLDVIGRPDLKTSKRSDYDERDGGAEPVDDATIDPATGLVSERNADGDITDIKYTDPFSHQKS